MSERPVTISYRRDGKTYLLAMPSEHAEWAEMMLNTDIAEVKAQALEEAAAKFSAEDDPEWGFWQDYEGWSCDPSEPLRARAEAYRQERGEQ